jgi:hypothetical protein
MSGQKSQEDSNPPRWRLTTNPQLYGLVIRERGEPIEYISYGEALKRQAEPARQK